MPTSLIVHLKWIQTLLVEHHTHILLEQLAIRSLVVVADEREQLLPDGADALAVQDGRDHRPHGAAAEERRAGPVAQSGELLVALKDPPRAFKDYLKVWVQDVRWLID